VLVAGDVTMAWNAAIINTAPDDDFVWNPDDAAEIWYEPGGAALIARLLRAVVKDSELHPRVIFEQGYFRKPKRHAEDGYHHSYAVWKKFKRCRDDGDDAELVWRMDQFLGFHGREDSQPRRQTRPHPRPDLIVIADSNLGCREEEMKANRWPSEIVDESPGVRPWVLLKAGAPLADGALWTHLVNTQPDRLIVIATLGELRLSGVRLRRHLSWEGMAWDVASQVAHHPSLRALLTCHRFVVMAATGGAIVLSPPSTKERDCWSLPPYELLFDPNTIDNSWTNNYEGKMIGYATCMTAALVQEFMRAEPNGEIDILRGVRRGLVASRVFHLVGFADIAPRPTFKPTDLQAETGTRDARLVFPVKKVAGALREDKGAIPKDAQCEFPSVHGVEDRNWTIMEAAYPDDPHLVAEAVAVNGINVALARVPVARFGKLVSIDRREMEGLRAVRDCLLEYSLKPSPRPLCISVFGPPGSGKSFAVREVAQDCIDASRLEQLTFNLSQMRDPGDLISAMHVVRDAGLRAKLPFVFWDEFDCDLDRVKLGWLRYFLQPMQDGLFLDRHVQHTIGPAIFVFAGGTHKTLADFDKADSDPRFRRRKGPDFLSRLKGNVDIVGINAPDVSLERKDRRTREERDPYCPIRRAVLLRSMLGQMRPNLFKGGVEKGKLNIDARVLRAILQVDEYRYGARSLEAVLTMSTLHDKAKFDRAALPPWGQLKLHVSSSFTRRLESFVPTEKELDLLARHVHAMRAIELARAGDNIDEYLAGHCLIPPLRGCDRKSDSPAERRPESQAWESLNRPFLDQNRRFAHTVAPKIERLKFWVQRLEDLEREGVVVPECSDDHFAEFAKREHRLWLERRQRAGWRLGPKLDADRREHPHVKPWEKLTPGEQALDVELGRLLCEIAKNSGLALAPMGPDANAADDERRQDDADEERRQRGRTADEGYRLHKLGEWLDSLD
jgi:hypothetical protein